MLLCIFVVLKNILTCRRQGETSACTSFPRKAVPENIDSYICLKKTISDREESLGCNNPSLHRTMTKDIKNCHCTTQSK